MIVHRTIEFDAEREEIEQALAGIVPSGVGGVQDVTWDLLRRFRNRVHGKEQFTHDQLVDVDEAIEELIEVLSPQARVEWWAAAGAPGAADAVEGLARERELQVDRLIDAQARVHYARVLIAPNRPIEQEVV